MAGTGDQESPRKQQPLLPAPARAPGPGGHPAPSGRSRGLCCGQAPGAGTAATRDFTPPSWEPAARCSQQCTSCFKESERVCWPRGRGAAADGASKGQRLAHAQQPSSQRSHAGGPQPPSLLARARPRPAGRGSSPSCNTHLPARISRSGSLGWAAGIWPLPPSCLTSLPCLRLPREESPPGRYKDRRSLAKREEAASMQIWEVNSHIPADPLTAASFRMGNYLSCALLTQRRSVCTATAIELSRNGVGGAQGTPQIFRVSPRVSQFRSRGSLVHLPDTNPPLSQERSPQLFFHVIMNHRSY